MNIPGVLNNIICEISNSNDCNLCWKFVFGGRSDYFNLAPARSEDDDSDGAPDCDCVRVGVLRIRSANVYDTSAGTVTLKHRDWFLEIFAGIPSDIGFQFYDEVEPKSKAESKWEKFLYPISCCMSGIPNTLCDQLSCCGSSTVDIVKWEPDMKLNYEDNNYDGWLISATLREYGD